MIYYAKSATFYILVNQYFHIITDILSYVITAEKIMFFISFMFLKYVNM
jgi:hypothetical protein